MTRAPDQETPHDDEASGDGAHSARAASSLAPRPRPGFTSRDDDVLQVPVESYVSFAAAVLRAGIGALFVFMATLWLPVHMMTPILTGMGILMVANGLLATWKLGRVVPRVARIARVIVWAIPLFVVVDLVLLGVLGPSSLGPDWAALRSAPQDVTSSSETP